MGIVAKVRCGVQERRGHWVWPPQKETGPALQHFLSSRIPYPGKDAITLITQYENLNFQRETSQGTSQQGLLKTQDGKTLLHVKHQCTLESIISRHKACGNLHQNEDGIQIDGREGDWLIKITWSIWLIICNIKKVVFLPSLLNTNKL